MNFWSLAVEEQFYLLWPLITLGLLALSSRVRVGAAVAIGGGSALLMALLYVPEADATRVYYGTDTHVVGLMAGAALAFAWASPRLARFVTPSRWGRFGALAGPVALLVLVAEMVLLDEQHPLTFRGGIALASISTAVLVMAVIDPAPAASGGPTALQRITRHPAATWVGARSYSIYLWHWPVILLVALDNPSAPGTLSHVLTRVWCVVVTLALADLTYRFVEGPFRTLGFRGVGRRVRGSCHGPVGADPQRRGRRPRGAAPSSSRRSSSPRPTRARRPGCSPPTRPQPPPTSRARPGAPSGAAGETPGASPSAATAPVIGSDREERDLHDARGQGHRRLRRLDAGRQPRRDALLLPRHPHRRQVQPSLV